MKATFLTLRVIHAGILLGPLGFLGVGLLIPRETAPQPVLMYVGIAAALAAGFLSLVLPRLVLAQFESGSSDVPIKRRVVAYQSAKIVQWGVVEAATLFNGVVFFLSGSEFSGGFMVGLIGLLVFQRPSVAECARLCGTAEARLEEE